MKIVQLLNVLHKHAFMYKGKCYVLINIPVMAKEARLTEKTTRDTINQLIHDFKLLRMNFNQRFYDKPDLDIWTLYEVVMPKELQELEDENILHHTTVFEIKQEADFRNSL